MALPVSTPALNTELNDGTKSYEMAARSGGSNVAPSELPPTVLLVKNGEIPKIQSARAAFSMKFEKQIAFSMKLPARREQLSL